MYLDGSIFSGANAFVANAYTLVSSLRVVGYVSPVQNVRGNPKYLGVNFPGYIQERGDPNKMLQVDASTLQDLSRLGVSVVGNYSPNVVGFADKKGVSPDSAGCAAPGLCESTRLQVENVPWYIFYETKHVHTPNPMCSTCTYVL